MTKILAQYFLTEPKKGQGRGSLVAAAGAAAGGRGLEQRRGNCDIKTNISRGMIGFQTSRLN